MSGKIKREDRILRPRVFPLAGEPLGFEVVSKDKDGLSHCVDLSGMDGNGYCTCDDFAARCIPNIKSQKKYLDGQFIRVPYWQLYWFDALPKPDARRTRRTITARPNPRRTQCKHIEAARKYWTDRTLKDIAEQQGQS